MSSLTEKIINRRTEIAYIISLILFALFFYGLNFITFKIITLVFFLIIQILMIRKYWDKIFFGKSLLVLLLIVFVLFFIGYIAISVSEIELAVIFTVSVPIILYFGLTGTFVYKMFKAKNIGVLIVLYIMIAVLIITIFGFIFALLNVSSTGNGIKWSDNSVVSEVLDHIYFSSQVFYQIGRAHV